MLNAEMLSDIIHSNGKTYGDCSNAIGVAPNTFTKIMKGKRELKISEADKLIEYLSITNSEVKVKLFLR